MPILKEASNTSAPFKVSKSGQILLVRNANQDTAKLYRAAYKLMAASSTIPLLMLVDIRYPVLICKRWARDESMPNVMAHDSSSK
mmetsp:Transcript_23990/g.35675  ORF Transcript_23990/g.35675 Transcript_23990/m.35675 type:complete len:85 (-) Transcript_23990:433-687(-)